MKTYTTKRCRFWFTPGVASGQRGRVLGVSGGAGDQGRKRMSRKRARQKVSARMAETFVLLLRPNLHSKQMPRQHLRALFSDSSSGVLSKHGCFLARWLWHTQSKILPKHHLSATRSLWRTYLKGPSRKTAPVQQSPCGRVSRRLFGNTRSLLPSRKPAPEAC